MLWGAACAAERPLEGVGLAGGACTLPDVRGHPLVCRVFSAAQTGVTSIHGCTGPPCPDVSPHATPAKGLRRARVPSPASKKGRKEKCGWRCSTSGLPVVKCRISSSWSAPAHSHPTLAFTSCLSLHPSHFLYDRGDGISGLLPLQYSLGGYGYGVADGPSTFHQLRHLNYLRLSIPDPYLLPHPDQPKRQ
jgi:hypothetical protein